MVDTPNTQHRTHDGDTPLWISLLLGGTAVLIILGFFLNGSKAHTAQWEIVLGAIATLGIFSLLYKENPFFRYLEHIFIGLATGYSCVFAWYDQLEPRWYTPMMPAGGGLWWEWIALLCGLLFFTVYFPKLSWMNRLAFGVLMGWGAGNAFQAFVGGMAPQIVDAFSAPVTNYNPAAMKALTTPMPLDRMNDLQAGGLWWHPFLLISLIVMLCTMAYFFFSIEHKKAWIRKPANAGRYFIMITLGAIFGTTVMSRLTLLIGRLEFLRLAVAGWWHMLFR